MAITQPQELTRKVRAVSELPVPSASRNSQPPPALDTASQLEGFRPSSGPRRLQAWFGATLIVSIIAVAITLWWRHGASGRNATDPPKLGPSASLPASGSTNVKATPAAPRELLDGAHRITTNGPETFRIGDSELTLAQASELRVSGGDAQGWFLALDAGRIECHVLPRAERPPFVVIAGETRVSVVGTRFSVDQSPEGTAVAVDEGTVRVEAHGHTTELVAGESWTETTPPARSGVESSAPILEPPRKAQVPEGTSPAATRRFERAARLESSRPEAALRLYRALRKKPSPLAASALYAEARLQFELGRPRRAKPLLQHYLKRYPEGANAGDARELLERLPARR
jgi:ferric-dicitrate binding protein FerR (iron transport regulator)